LVTFDPTVTSIAVILPEPVEVNESTVLPRHFPKR